MNPYDEFAEVYARGGYPAFSARVAEVLPSALARFGFSPHTLLDVACGEGTFAVAMAARGLAVTGVDISPRMLALAEQRAAAAGAPVRLLHGDMRDLPFCEEFDLVTCWYDSLNYLPSCDDLCTAFASAYRALKPGGVYACDMNTRWGLAVNWRSPPCSVEQDTPEVFEVHRPTYDFERDEAALLITAFVREGARWRRIEERHREYGFRSTEIRALLHGVGFEELATCATLSDLSPPAPDSGRLFFLRRKPGTSDRQSFAP